MMTILGMNKQDFFRPFLWFPDVVKKRLVVPLEKTKYYAVHTEVSQSRPLISHFNHKMDQNAPLQRGNHSQMGADLICW